MLHVDSLFTGLSMDDEINIDAPAHISLDEKLTSIASNPFLELSAERAYTSEGLSRVSQHSLAAFGESAFSAGPGSSEGISAHRVKGNGNGNGNGSPSDPKSPGVMGMNFVKGFSGVQKKITRGEQTCDSNSLYRPLSNKQMVSPQKDEDPSPTVNPRKHVDRS